VPLPSFPLPLPLSLWLPDAEPLLAPLEAILCGAVVLAR
jgi:hypothetical protein